MNLKVYSYTQKVYINHLKQRITNIDPHDKTLFLNMMGMKVVLVAILVTLTRLALVSSSGMLMYIYCECDCFFVMVISTTIASRLAVFVHNYVQHSILLLAVSMYTADYAYTNIKATILFHNIRQ